MSDKIQPQHLQRKVVLYVRQSSQYQVEHNLESQRLQYGMQQRLRSLGWQEIEVIDEDLGRSAAGDIQRAGFERMVAEVCLGKVGAVAAREVSRFARNSRDWQQLIGTGRGRRCWRRSTICWVAEFWSVRSYISTSGSFVTSAFIHRVDLSCCSGDRMADLVTNDPLDDCQASIGG